MSRLDFLYRTELPHRAVAVYIYLADRTNENKHSRNTQKDTDKAQEIFRLTVPVRCPICGSLTALTFKCGLPKLTQSSEKCLIEYPQKQWKPLTRKPQLGS